MQLGSLAGRERVSLGGKVYVRTGDRTTLKLAVPVKPLTEPGIGQLWKALAEDRKACAEARAKLLDHYQSVLRILDDLRHLLYPKGATVPTDNAEGKMLVRILFASCADTFEAFMSDLLYQVYLARPEALKSPSPVRVEDVLNCAHMEDFISWCAKDKLTRLQAGASKNSSLRTKR